MTRVQAGTASRRDVRARIVDAAAGLLAEHGPAAVTTRAVAEAAATQAPTIYRLFGDKDGLLDAVAEHVMATYVAAKSSAAQIADGQGADPVEDLRAGWDTYVAFGLANPSLFALLNDPERAGTSPASAAGLQILQARVRRSAAARRLRVSERRAVDVLHAAGTGAVLTLLALPPEERDPDLAETMWAAASRTVLTDAGSDSADSAGSAASTTATAVAFRAVLTELPALSEAEQALIAEWLDRTINALQEGQT